MSARILIVEDTPHNLQLMSYLLKARGHVVLGAGDGDQGLSMARAHHPDLVVMDLQLPVIDGYEVLKFIRADEELANIPIVAVTAFAMVGDRDQALGAGFDDYFTKPIEPETFALQIERHLSPALRGHEPVIASTPQGAVTSASVPHRQSNGAVVLVVDDLATNVALIRSVLEPHGYRVVVASTIAQAGEAIAVKHPDLVLCDVHIGTESGTDLLATLREATDSAHVRFAFVTATSGPLDPIVGKYKARVIRRPIEPAQLLEEVRSLIATDIATDVVSNSEV